jgi:hypothetical protein
VAHAHKYADDLRARIFDDSMITAMIPVIAKMLGSNSAVEWLSLAANHGRFVNLSKAGHPQTYTEDLRSRLFDNTMIAAMTAAIRNMLSSSDNSAREAALNLLSMTTNHSEPVGFH